MEKYKVAGILVVEGKTDVAFLETFLDANFVTTNGSEVSKETINYIKELSKTNKIIVLTDPDSPGTRIRNLIEENVPGVYHAFVDKKVSIKKHKVGVAESTKDEVLKGLKNMLIYNKEKDLDTLSMKDVIELGLTGNNDSSYKREQIANHFNLGYCSTNKTFIKRCNSLKLTKDILKNYLDTL